MPSLKTEITEIVTGLGMLPFHSLGAALAARPPQVGNVADPVWARLSAAHQGGDHGVELSGAWANGRAFLEAADGLRGRTPRTIEWKGPDKPPGYELLPADLRIDHVFLVSCKYLSRVLHNVSPDHLFERGLAQRGARAEVDWYLRSAPAEYGALYAGVRAELHGELDLPASVKDLTKGQRDHIKARCARSWPAAVQPDYEALSVVVSEVSARTWSRAVPTLADREDLLWRLLRLTSAPYFILGSAGQDQLRLRVGTPWDWRQRFRLVDLDIRPERSAQPLVRWTAAVRDLEAGTEREVRGHVEVRWSHGRFCGHPEAKVYLDTPHRAVPGYFPLD